MKKTIEFDQRGYLYPYILIELDLADFQNHFVDNFPKSETRQKYFPILWIISRIFKEK